MLICTRTEYLANNNSHVTSDGVLVSKSDIEEIEELTVNLKWLFVEGFDKICEFHLFKHSTESMVVSKSDLEEIRDLTVQLRGLFKNKSFPFLPLLHKNISYICKSIDDRAVKSWHANEFFSESRSEAFTNARDIKRHVDYWMKAAPGDLKKYCPAGEKPEKTERIYRIEETISALQTLLTHMLGVMIYYRRHQYMQTFICYQQVQDLTTAIEHFLNAEFFYEASDYQKYKNTLSKQMQKIKNDLSQLTTFDIVPKTE